MRRNVLGLESGELLPLWRPLFPLTGLDRAVALEALTVEWGSRQEEVEEETGSGKCGSRLFS